jgi:hypothetical protein
MREAGTPSAGEVAVSSKCARAPGVAMFAPPAAPHNALLVKALLRHAMGWDTPKNDVPALLSCVANFLEPRHGEVRRIHLPRLYEK